jgi:hypothetical protein
MWTRFTRFKRWALIAEKMVDAIFGPGYYRASAIDPEN